MKTTVHERRKLHSQGNLGSALTMLNEAMARFPVGTRVGLSQDMDHTGVVTGYNFSADGYYPTGRYPLIVLFGEGELECSLDMVVRL